MADDDWIRELFYVKNSRRSWASCWKIAFCRKRSNKMIAIWWTVGEQGGQSTRKMRFAENVMMCHYAISSHANHTKMVSMVIYTKFMVHCRWNWKWLRGERVKNKFDIDFHLTFLRTMIAIAFWRRCFDDSSLILFCKFPISFWLSEYFVGTFRISLVADWTFAEKVCNVHFLHPQMPNGLGLSTAVLICFFFSNKWFSCAISSWMT